eukprot:GHVS01095615.1.p1 GENE.GHVS01095615.1~~GHVS01095615.1.p1  ORF type:complete len:220 (+),score=58.73 GHVS01095615.1:40-660(+)
MPPHHNSGMPPHHNSGMPPHHNSGMPPHHNSGQHGPTSGGGGVGNRLQEINILPGKKGGNRKDDGGSGRRWGRRLHPAVANTGCRSVPKIQMLKCQRQKEVLSQRPCRVMEKRYNCEDKPQMIHKLCHRMVKDETPVQQEKEAFEWNCDKKVEHDLPQVKFPANSRLSVLPAQAMPAHHKHQEPHHHQEPYHHEEEGKKKKKNHRH